MGKTEIVFGFGGNYLASALCLLSRCKYGYGNALRNVLRRYLWRVHIGYFDFSPKIFPRFISVCLFMISALLLAQGIAGVRKNASGKRVKLTVNKAFLIRIFSCILIAYAYTRLLTITGYVVATPLFITGIMLLFNEKKWWKIMITSIITTSLLYILFRIIFRVPLPRFTLF